MKEANYTRFRALCATFAILVMCCVAIAAKKSNTNLTCIFSGPSDNYQIELFEVGAPYPSRQSPGNGSKLSPTWYSVVTKNKNYFVRVTKNRKEVKQSVMFWMPDNPPTSLSVTVDWNSLPHLSESW